MPPWKKCFLTQILGNLDIVESYKPSSCFRANTIRAGRTFTKFSGKASYQYVYEHRNAFSLYNIYREKPFMGDVPPGAAHGDDCFLMFR